MVMPGGHGPRYTKMESISVTVHWSGGLSEVTKSPLAIILH